MMKNKKPQTEINKTLMITNIKMKKFSKHF